MSARCAKALIGAVPRRRFGYFAAVGKVTLVSPPHRTELFSKKFSSLCSAAPTAAHWLDYLHNITITFYFTITITIT